jgi:hypothetical protein
MKTIKSWFSKITKGAMVQTAALMIIPVSCSMMFAACSNLADTPQNLSATATGSYLEQREEQAGYQPVDVDPEPDEWFY